MVVLPRRPSLDGDAQRQHGNDHRTDGRHASRGHEHRPPHPARAIGLAVGERTGGPLFTGGDGRRLDRHGAARIVRRVTRRAGIAKLAGPHTLRHAFITAALDAGVPLRDVQEADLRTTMR